MNAAGVRVDYHVHTAYSYDSGSELDAIVERALTVGIDCLCVTDHGTVEGALALARLAPPEVEIVVGCELDADDGSQVLALDVERAVNPMPIFELFAAVKAQGGRILLPHPFRRSSGVFRPELRRSEGFIEDVLGQADLVECFNGRDSYDNNRRNAQLAERKSVVAVAGSDAHTPAEIGSVYVEYPERPLVHGSAPRRVWFADQVFRPESRTRRTLMEFYHRHERRLPAVVGSSYRAARRRVHRDRPRAARGEPKVQFEFDEGGGITRPSGPVPPDRPGQ